MATMVSGISIADSREMPLDRAPLASTAPLKPWSLTATEIFSEFPLLCHRDGRDRRSHGSCKRLQARRLRVDAQPETRVEVDPPVPHQDLPARQLPHPASSSSSSSSSPLPPPPPPPPLPHLGVRARALGIGPRAALVRVVVDEGQTGDRHERGTPLVRKEGSEVADVALVQRQRQPCARVDAVLLRHRCLAVLGLLVGVHRVPHVGRVVHGEDMHQVAPHVRA
eukprot:763143-Hanusia_phi.AAC.5